MNRHLALLNLSHSKFVLDVLKFGLHTFEKVLKLIQFHLQFISTISWQQVILLHWYLYSSQA